MGAVENIAVNATVNTGQAPGVGILPEGKVSPTNGNRGFGVVACEPQRILIQLTGEKAVVKILSGIDDGLYPKAGLGKVSPRLNGFYQFGSG